MRLYLRLVNFAFSSGRQDCGGGGGDLEGDSHEYNGSMPRLVFFCFRHGGMERRVQGCIVISEAPLEKNTYYASLDIFVKCYYSRSLPAL